MFSAKYSENEPTSAAPANDPHFAVTRRTSVSAECDSPDGSSSTSNSGTVGGTPVSEAAVTALSKIFLFQGLGTDSLVKVARALAPRTAAVGDKIITEGDEGDFFYILETGSVHYDIGGKSVGKSGAGSCFGELALMYNSPRAASVVADEACSLWALDRTTFKSIMVQARSEKRKQSLRVLDSIDLLNGLDQQAKLRLADALLPQSFEAEADVIVEGDSGTYFYMIDEGTARVTAGGKVLTTLTKGDYFGELALLDNSPRAATVTATSTLKLERLNKEGFERMLGPEVVAELRRRDPRKN